MEKIEEKSSEQNDDYKKLQERLRTVLFQMEPFEQEVLKMRFGLDDGYSLTLDEVGLYFNMSRERIRQIEAKALRRIRRAEKDEKLEVNGEDCLLFP